MAWVYQNKTTDPNAYAENGWDIMPMNVTGGAIVVFKEITIPIEDDLVVGLINQYESDDFRKNALGIKKISDYYEKIGYRFSSVYVDDEAKKRNKLILDGDTVKKLTTWRVEMDFSDGYLRLSPFDIFFPYSFYNKRILDKYAPEIVSSLRGEKLVKCATISS